MVGVWGVEKLGGGGTLRCMELRLWLRYGGQTSPNTEESKENDEHKLSWACLGTFQCEEFRV